MSIKKISIITVCLNVRDTIRMTMESVRNQNYPDIEHVLIDGGSTDGTQDIIREYDPGYFTSGPDNGVYDAMDKGAAAATGDIAIFLNAGDTFFDRDVCRRVAAFFDETKADIVFGNLLPVYLDQADTHDHGAFVAGQIVDLGYVMHRGHLYDESIHHQATFYRRWVLQKCTYKASTPEATGEYNLLMNAVFVHRAKVKHIPITVSRFVLGGISTRNFEKEWAKYSKAREILRGTYLPKGRPRIRKPHEFRHGFRLASGGPSRKHALKLRIQRSFLFKAYARLATGLSARISNLVVDRVDEYLQLRLRQSLPTVVDQVKAQLLARDKKELRRIKQEVGRQLAESTRHVATKDDLQGILALLTGKLNDHSREVTHLRQMLDSVRQSNDLLGSKVTDSHVTISEVHQSIIETPTIASHGYRVMSQWNEDGIIQYILDRIGRKTSRFIEVGVNDYSESNTRFLVLKDNWRGLIIDSDEEALKRFTEQGQRWKTDVDVLSSFVTAENINTLIENAGYSGEIDVFSLDIDGVDYWVWKALDVVSPRVVICEYNAIFGPQHAITVPYDATFDRREKHSSWIYAGASIQALATLAASKGYTLVACNSGGNNAFFVRNDLMRDGNLLPDPVLYQPPAFRESRDAEGRLTFLAPPEAIKLLADMPVIDVKTDQEIRIGDLTW